ncbi:hypothetical protein IAR50_007439 [Cryptococcus sp. DSM 104548]
MLPEISEVEAKVTEALEVASQQENPNIAALAREYDVPIKRLRNRYKSIPSKHDKKPVNKALSDEQEKVLLEWIRRLDGWGYVPTKKTVQESTDL